MVCKSSLLVVIFICFFILFLGGCGRDWKAEIDSNTSWYGYYGGVTGNKWVTSEIQGHGSKTIDLPDDDRICCVFYQTGEGYLSIKIKDDGGNPFHMFAEDSRGTSTNVNGGTIEICNEGTVPSY